jgi:CRISPR/Cas system CMR subunit Cmr6 (Cas7 group RAMP superfamily)
MPSLLNSTKEALGGEALPHCQSRALRLTRYARPELNDESQPTRHDFLQSVAAAQRTEAGLDSWRTWLGTAAKPEHTIHAKLEARLLINMGGTVLENAGLQLDRFGTAYLPGSAVKACARRTVVAALRQWCETGTKPEAASDDALAPICAPFSAPIDLLLAIVRVFGCTDLEWQGYDYEENKGNDLAWACAKQWPVLCDQVRAILNRDTSTPEETAPTRRGCVAFLPAYPHTRPAADLELDVLTSHHPKYYGETWTSRPTPRIRYRSISRPSPPRDLHLCSPPGWQHRCHDTLASAQLAKDGARALRSRRQNSRRVRVFFRRHRRNRSQAGQGC